MAGPLYLSIDCGLTATKAALFDEAGEELSSAVRDTVVETGGGASEIDMERQWELATTVVRETMMRSGSSPRAVACVSVSGHGGGLYPIDVEGRPVRAALTSMDGRASAVVAAAERSGFPTLRATRHRPWAGQSLPQMRWLKDANAEEYDRVRWFLGAKDWITFRLSGSIYTDRTDASNDGLVDLDTETYDRNILRAFGVEDAFSKLPPVAASATIVGGVSSVAARETGLAPGTPVAAGMFDVVACATGSGALGTEAYSVIAGTWNINGAFDPRLLASPPSVKTSLGPDEGRYAYVESSATSAGNLSWFLGVIETLYKIGVSASSRPSVLRGLDEAVDACPVGSRGLVFLPFIHRADIAPGTDGAFVGMRADHGAAEFARAIFEGVAFAHRAHLERLRSAGLERGRVILSGGAANSEAWCRVFAGAIGRKVETSDASQAGARGVAMAAAIGTGRYAGYEEAEAAMSRADKRFDPVLQERKAYEEAYARWREAASLLGRLG